MFIRTDGETETIQYNTLKTNTDTSIW